MKKKKKHKHKKRQHLRSQKFEEKRVQKHDANQDIAAQVEEIAKNAGDQVKVDDAKNAVVEKVENKESVDHHSVAKEQSMTKSEKKELRIVEKEKKKEAKKAIKQQKIAKKEEAKKHVAVKADDAQKNKHVHTHHQCQSSALRKKVKNLTSYLILAFGFLLGSLYVDVAQLFSERGLSARALGEATVVEYDGATWVKFEEPKVVVDVFTEKNCIDETCEIVSEILAQLHRFIPTLEARQINVSTTAGKAYAKSLGLGYVPAFHFAEDLDQTSFYTQAASLFTPREDGTYVLNIDRVDVPVEKYIESPQEEGVILGKESAPHTIVLFENFTCETCRPLHENLVKVFARFPEQLRVVIKNVPGRDDDIARDAAHASLCAYEQGKYEPYAQALFVGTAWKAKKSNEREKAFNAIAGQIKEFEFEQFQTCFQEKGQNDKLIADINDAERLGIAVTPVLFINGEVQDISDMEKVNASIETLFE